MVTAPLTQDPHRSQPVLAAGAPLDKAKGALLMVHGRGATAEDILSLALELRHADFAYLAPQAADNVWYPYRFMAPIERNEPWLSSALAKLAGVLAQISAAGLPPEKTVILGFSQGACLSLEYGARHARRYGGLVGLSGGLIGPEGTPRNYPGSLDGTPVFLGCSDVDPHIPKERVDETAAVLRALGGEVSERLYPNLAHTVNRDELLAVRQIMDTLVKSSLDVG
jgi:phospholipase/carboxylesterase